MEFAPRLDPEIEICTQNLLVCASPSLWQREGKEKMSCDGVMMGASAEAGAWSCLALWSRPTESRVSAKETQLKAVATSAHRGRNVGLGPNMGNIILSPPCPNTYWSPHVSSRKYHFVGGGGLQGKYKAAYMYLTEER